MAKRTDHVIVEFSVEELHRIIFPENGKPSTFIIVQENNTITVSVRYEREPK